MKCYLIWKKQNTNNHINLASFTFSIKAYKKIKEKNSLENLTDTAKDFFHMIFQFKRLKKKQIKVIIAEDQFQELATYTCGIFQLYFYKNLSNPLSNSKIINDEFQ